MAAATARAPAADKRWGFAAAAAAAAPTRMPAVGVLGTAPKPTNHPTQRGAFPWGDRPTPPAPNVWGSSSLLPLKNDGGSGSFGNMNDNDGGSGSFGNMNDRPSSRGSSRTSTDGSDLLDSPLASGRTSHNSTTVISHPQRTELRSGSWRFPHSQSSFSDALRGPLNSIAKRRPTSHGKGFTLSADDFPVLGSKSSQSNSQLGNSFQGRPTFSSVIIASRDEQRKIPPTGGGPFSTADFSMEAQQAQLHATQTPDICMPPPCIDYWHPPPDHPPDRNGIWHLGVASYGPGKVADTHGSFPVESFTDNGQSLLNQGGETRHGPAHGVYQTGNNDSCYAHVPADTSVKTLPHLMLGKVKDNHSDALEKQVIKKDVALLEKIKCLNIKARNLRAGNISEISSCRESKVGHPKRIGAESYHVANDAPVSAVICDITSAFDMANSVSDSSNHVPIGTSNVSASANLVMIDLSEGNPTIFIEAREPGECADNDVYGVGSISRNRHVSSATNTASDIWGPGWEDHSTVDMIKSTASDIWGPGWEDHSTVDMITNTASDIWGPGWEDHSTVDSLPVDMINAHEDQLFAGNSLQQVDVRTADIMLNSHDYEIQNSMREISAQHEKQPQGHERGEIGQKPQTIVKLEDLHRHPFVQSQNSNGTPGKPADYHAYRGGNSSRKWHGSSAEDISSSISGHGWEDHQDLSFSGNTSSWQPHMRTDDMINSSDYEIQHSRRDLSAKRSKQLQKEERGKTQQKAESTAKLEDLSVHPLIQSQKSKDTAAKSADAHEYGEWNGSRNKCGGSTEDIPFNISGHGWEDHPGVESLPVVINSHQGQSGPWNTTQQLHTQTNDDRHNSHGYEIKHSRWRESSVQHAKELQKEKENIQQKATSIAKPQGLIGRPFPHNQKSNDAPGKSADYHEYGGWHSSRNRHGSSAEDISFNMPGSGWEDQCAVDSLPFTTNTHQDQSFPGNSSWQMHARTADVLNSPGYEVQHSRRQLSAQHAKGLPEHERGETQQKAKPKSQKSDDSPGKSADYLVYGGGNALRNRNITSAEDISFKISGHGWEDHPTVDSMPVVMTNTHQNQSFPWNTAEQVHERTIDDMINSPDYETQLSRRELSAQHARQLQKEERGELQPKAKVNAKLEELNRSSSVQKLKSNDVPLEADKILCKQGAERSDTYCTAYAGNLNKPLRANVMQNATVPICSTPAPDTASVSRGPLTHNAIPLAKKTDTNMLEHTAQKIPAQSHDSSAPKHLQVEDMEGQVHKQESILRVSTTASGTTDANKGPFHNAFPSVKNTDINMIHIDQKGASELYDSTTPKGRILRAPPASESEGLNKGSPIHNVMPSAKNNGINMKEYIARKSVLQSHENSAPKHLQMEIRRRQVRSQEGVLRERSNIAESTENITTDAGTLVDRWNTEAKPHVEPSTQSKNRRPASPLVFGTKNTEASSVHKARISGVVINSAIIPVQVSSVRGFTVGSIMLGDASLAFVNEEKTVAKEMHDSIPKQTEQSGTNQPGVQRVEDPHGSDRIIRAPVKESKKKEQSEAGGLNCAAIPSPIQPSGNQSIISKNLVPAKTSEMERHAHKPAYKELDLQNPRQTLLVENHKISSDNLSTSKSDTKTVHKEALGAPSATKAEVEIEIENREGEKTSKHLGRSCASSNQGSTKGSASAAAGLNEQEANSVLKIMQELSDQLEQVEKQLDSCTHVAAVNRPQTTQLVSMPGYTWGENHASRSQRQYHVDGQGNMWINYAANSHMDRRVMAQGPDMQTAHLLSGPVPVPENNLAGVKVGPASGWKLDTTEHVLISDMGDAPGLSMASRGAASAQNAYRVGQMDVMVSVQATGVMAYRAATAVNHEVLYHASPELEQLNLAWLPHVQYDSVQHRGSGGTGVYLPGMNGGGGAQAHGGGGGYLTGPPMVGPVQHPEYQLVPAAVPLATGWTDGDSTMVPAVGHPAETWGEA